MICSAIGLSYSVRLGNDRYRRDRLVRRGAHRLLHLLGGKHDQALGLSLRGESLVTAALALDEGQFWPVK